MTVSAVILALCLAQSPPLERKDFIRGADMSFIPQYEEAGVQFFRGDTAEDPLVTLSREGMNLLRVRLWVNHPEKHCSTLKVIRLIKRAHALKMKVLLNFHYSDDWADPQHQVKPKRWEGMSFDDLIKQVEAYSKDVLATTVRWGAVPEMVQVGNEISGGMIWPEGRVKPGDSYDKLIALINAGIRGTKAGLGKHKTQIMLHIDKGGRMEETKRFFDAMKTAKVQYDIIGQSYYPFWHGNLDDLRANLAMMAERYRKPIVVVETAYPFTTGWKDQTPNFVGNPNQLVPGYPATKEGQAKFLAAVRKAVRETPLGLGLGICYWAPEYVAHPKIKDNPYENLALWDFENKLCEPGARAFFSPNP